MTTAGDIIYGGVSGAGTRLGIGSNGYVLTVSSGNPVWAADSSGVTSVAQSFTGGIVSVTGSPITTSGTLALTVAGTSGGVPYFSSGTTWASSAALTQYGIVYGGGAGNAPVATAAGTTGQFLGANTGGAPTWQTPSASPGGSNTQIQFNNSSAFGGSANLVWDGTYVGVGTSSPSTYGDSTPGAVTYNSTAGGRSGISLGSNSTAADDILGAVNFFSSNTSNTNYRMAKVLGMRGADANSSYLRFDTANSGSPAESLRLNGVGTVILKGGSTSATGVGITFPATASLSTNANTLDDYEEGTWTPTLGGTATYGTRIGYYTKVGRLVLVSFQMDVTLIGTGSATTIDGLPFNGGPGGNPIIGATYYDGISSARTVVNTQFTGGTSFYFVGPTAAATSSSNVISVFTNGTILRGSFSYIEA
jgi:hypothetical protein